MPATPRKASWHGGQEIISRPSGFYWKVGQLYWEQGHRCPLTYILNKKAKIFETPQEHLGDSYMMLYWHGVCGVGLLSDIFLWSSFLCIHINNTISSTTARVLILITFKIVIHQTLLLSFFSNAQTPQANLAQRHKKVIIYGAHYTEKQTFIQISKNGFHGSSVICSNEGSLVLKNPS